jgi:hypothetical protein
VRSIAGDVRYVLGLREESLLRRSRWTALAVWMSFTREFTAYLVEHEQAIPTWVKDRLSHERKLKRQRGKPRRSP